MYEGISKVEGGPICGSWVGRNADRCKAQSRDQAVGTEKLSRNAGLFQFKTTIFL